MTSSIVSRGGRHANHSTVGLRRPAPLASDLVELHRGQPPRNKGLTYPPDPPTVEEIIAVMRAAGDGAESVRLRGSIVVLWRAGLRISEALALNETDLDPDRGSLIVRHGKGDKPREVGMDRGAWTQLTPWLKFREALPVGCSASFAARHKGPPCAPAGIRAQLHRAAAIAGVRRWWRRTNFGTLTPSRCLARDLSDCHPEHLGPADLAITSRYLRGIDNTEIIAAVHDRPAPMIPADPRSALRH